MKDWTMMVYMAGDNGKVFDGRRLMADLQIYGWRDLAEMSEVGSTDRVAVLAQYDTLTERQFTPRFFIDGSKPAGQLVEKVPPVNTGAPKNLTDFIVWGTSNYPAKRYALVLWNHGTGWKEDDVYARYREKLERAVSSGETRAGSRGEQLLRNALFLSTVGEIMSIEDDETRGICYDDSSMDFLDTREMVAALHDAEEQTGQRISLLGMDACLMSMAEVAYQMRNHAQVMVGSQENEPGEGWPYTGIVSALVDNPDMSPRELSERIVREYGAYWGMPRGGGGTKTQSAIDLLKMETLAQRIGNLARVLSQAYDADFAVERAIGRALKRGQRFGGDKDYIDLCDFVRLLQMEYSAGGLVAAAIEQLKAGLDRSSPHTPIVANVNGSNRPNAYGLSIYFPDQGCSEYYGNLDLANLGWKDLLYTVNQIEG